MHNKTVQIIIYSLLGFFLSAGASFGITTYLYTPEGGDSPTPVATPTLGGGLNIDPNAPKTAECPINGVMHTAAEQKVWETRRPLFIMIENSVDARPQSGLTSADIIYEAVAEGGITRFGAVFYCGIAAKDTILGPVRSARTYFIDLASEYNYPLYTHVGGANCSSADGGKTCTTDKRVQALEQINQYDWGGRKGNDLNQFSIGFPTFWRDYERLGRTVATEHTMYTSSEKLYKYALNTRGWTNESPAGDDWKTDYTPFKFKDEAKIEDRGSVNSVNFGFWDGYKDFNVTWKYDKTTNLYSRENGGSAHLDLNNQQQLSAKVVVVQLAKEIGPLDDHKHLFYDVIGNGEALVFQDGNSLKATWTKKNREARTIFKDATHKELDFSRGTIWIEVIPKGSEVLY